MNGTHICYNVDQMSADRLMLISKGFDGIDSHLPTEKAVEKKKQQQGWRILTIITAFRHKLLR